jgi:hypothetical protein
MSLYLLVKFAHVVSTLWLFAGIAFEWFVLSQLPRSDEPPTSRIWPRSSRVLPFLTVFPIPLILFTGAYLAIKIEGLGWAWIKSSFLVLFLLAVSGVASWRQLARLRQGPERSGSADAARAGTDARPLLMTNRFRLCVALAVVFIMVARTNAIASGGVIVASLIAALLWSFLIWTHAPRSA